METYYDILGVKDTASYDEIRDSFRRKIREWHPDVNPHRREKATEQTRRIIEAHEVLRNPEARRSYDDYLRHQREEAKETFRRRADTQRQTKSKPQDEWDENFATATNYGRQARKTAERYSNIDLGTILRTFWGGSEAYRSSEAGIGSTIKVGWAGWTATFFIILGFTTCVGALTWWWVYLGVKGALFPNGKFVGIGTLIKGMLFWLVIFVIIAVVVFAGISQIQ